MEITAPIPNITAKQEKFWKTTNKSLFTKDYFVFDKYKNVFHLSRKRRINTIDGQYTAPLEKRRGNKIKLLYSNHETYNKSKHKEKKYFTRGHKTITQYDHELSYKTKKLMSTKKRN